MTIDQSAPQQKAITTENHVNLVESETAIHPSTGRNILNWKIKTIAFHNREIMRMQLLLGIGYIAMFLFNVWIWGDAFIQKPYWAVILILVFAGNYAYFVSLLIRQKTIYHYAIKTDQASVEYYLHYPNFASGLFKGIALFVIIIFVLVALITGSLLFLIGPVAMAFIAAVKLLNWENPIHHRQTRPWQEHNFVTVDHKRLMVIIHCTDVTTGFAARFPSKELMSKYLAFLREVLPATAEYTEKATKWHQG
ncbi:permease [Pseudomonas syringae]|uniref:permease n=1 Tax=Pseudomonas syringae TaxID=317 RepID=UPI001F1DA6E9|nr:permease [Pseudomonas syringae]